MKNTEVNALLAMIEALMGYRMPCQIHGAGVYSTSTRRIEIDCGNHDIGPIIGQAGSMKLAIQTLLALPFGGDACQLVFFSTRTIRKEPPANPRETEGKIRAMLDAMREHYHPHPFSYRMEHSETALVVLVEASGIMVSGMRGALSKVIRAVGRRHGMVAVVSIEQAATQAA